MMHCLRFQIKDIKNGHTLLTVYSLPTKQIDINKQTLNQLIYYINATLLHQSILKIEHMNITNSNCL